MAAPKLQALVYDILPSTTAVFSYAIGPRKLSANEQFCCWWCSNSSKFVTNNSDYIRRLFYVAMLFTPAQIRPKSFELRRNSLFLPGVDGAHVYVRVWMLGCFYSLSEGADRVGGQLCGDKECPFSGVTKSGRVWRKVPESDDRSVGSTQSWGVQNCRKMNKPTKNPTTNQKTCFCIN